MPNQLNTTRDRIQHLIKQSFKILKKDVNAVGTAKDFIEQALNALLKASLQFPADFDDLIKNNDSKTKPSPDERTNPSSAEESKTQSSENEKPLPPENLNIQDDSKTKDDLTIQNILEGKNNPSSSEKKRSPAEIAKKIAIEYLESLGIDPQLLEEKTKKAKEKKKSKEKTPLALIKTKEKKHDDYEHGSSCPCCKDGTLYDTQNPGSQKIFELKVQLIIHETLFQRLRCGKCGTYFTAKNDTPDAERFAPETKACFAVMRSEGGLPFHRSSHLFSMLGINLSKSVIFQACEDVANVFELVMPAMNQEVANAPILHADDTTVKILEVSRKEKDPNYKPGTSKDPNKRLSSRTSIIIGTDLENKIIGCIFIPSEKHCGENLEDILKLRTVKESPVVMADMSTCSDSPEFKKNKTPENLKYIRAGCNDHSLRKIKEAAKNYPTELNPLIELYQQVYVFDERFSRYGHKFRFEMHKKFSLPIMKEIYDLAQALLDGPDPKKKVEPNSSAGQALKYFIKYYSELIIFTDKPGAPLSNAAAERALKKTILIRKNSYFFKTLHGAKVTGLLNTATHSCHMIGCNPYEYFLDLLNNIEQIKKDPAMWTPLRYHQRRQEIEDQEVKTSQQVSFII
jgi:hypothetical protein